MNPVLAVRIAAVLGGLAVAFGAFGAHGLKERLAGNMEIFETAVRYHFYHALVLLALGFAPPALWSGRLAPAAAWALVFGVLLFSGSLYALALTNIRWLGAITPIGGLGFIAGWALIALAAGRLATRV